MTPNEILEVKRSCDNLYKFCNGGAIRYESGKIDKFGTGFNRDGRFSLAGEHKISYDSWVGSYGCSDCSTQIKFRDDTARFIFWQSFDEYLNEHQDEILNEICKKINKKLSTETDSIKKKISELNELLASLDVDKN